MDIVILCWGVAVVIMAGLLINATIDCGAMKAGLLESQAEYNALVERWNDLAEKVNDKKGAMFMCSMFYASSNARPRAFELMKNYRVP